MSRVLLLAPWTSQNQGPFRSWIELGHVLDVVFLDRISTYFVILCFYHGVWRKYTIQVNVGHCVLHWVFGGGGGLGGTFLELSAPEPSQGDDFCVYSTGDIQSWWNSGSTACVLKMLPFPEKLLQSKLRLGPVGSALSLRVSLCSRATHRHV